MFIARIQLQNFHAPWGAPFTLLRNAAAHHTVINNLSRITEVHVQKL